jgi:hypothetical protein
MAVLGLLSVAAAFSCVLRAFLWLLTNFYNFHGLLSIATASQKLVWGVLHCCCFYLRFTGLPVLALFCLWFLAA